MSAEILDCGHVESPHSPITRGYGTDRDSGKRYCYACCLARDVERLRTTGRLDAYLSSDGTEITTWPGQRIARVTSSRNSYAGGFAGRTLITNWRGVLADGTRVYGRGPGRGMYTRVRLAKGGPR